MAKRKKKIIGLQCTVCKSINYYKRKSKNPKKLELKKFCKKCKKHTLHKEARV